MLEQALAFFKGELTLTEIESMPHKKLLKLIEVRSERLEKERKELAELEK